MRHTLRRALDLGGVPVTPAIGGYLHLANGAPTGPGQAADLVEALAGQLLTAGWERDDRLRSDLISQGRFLLVRTEVALVVVVHVVPVDQLDSTQILRREDAFEAGNHQPQREPLLGPQRLAVHAVAHETVVHGLRQRHARRALHFFRAFRDEPRGATLHAALFEQRREKYSSPFSATGHPVRFLDGFGPGRRPVPRALDEMQAGDRRKALQVLHREGQRTIHHSVDHQTMVTGINVRYEGTTRCPHVEEGGWRD